MARPTSRSTKSSSTSSPGKAEEPRRQHKGRPQLARTLAREVSCRVAEQEDMRFLWAAYRKGWLLDIGVPGGMTVEQFNDAMGRLIPKHWAVWTLVAPVSGRGSTPVGIVTGEPWGERRLRASAWFFPWASPRNRVASVVNFASRMRGVQMFIAAVRRGDIKFADHLCRYGLGKRAGTVHGWFDDGDGRDAALFQSKDLI